ncbi:MAG: tRNA-dihydrouridine synthase family protein [Lachnospiraceae bacterium]|nr:tRNA-dihydrouridine synthase family protein [Lachnospiraceae bacterium]
MADMLQAIRFDFAPMEGVTDHIFRCAHSRVFPGVSRYFTPFIAANESRSMKTKEKRDVAPEHNSGVVLIPQILTNKPEVFLWAAERMRGLGYSTVNLNLGCPSATVVSHGKGSGFLADPGRLDSFFENVFDALPEGIHISVKTRIGVADADEAPALLEIFNRYPLSELIVHPRLRKDFYRGEPDLDTFEMFYEEYRGKLVYNGDIRSPERLGTFTGRFPDIRDVMIGRGLIADPALIRELSGGAPAGKDELKLFHDEILAGRMEEQRDFRNVAGRMKELWFYLGSAFDGAEKYLKKVKKSGTFAEYTTSVDALFSSCALSTDPRRNDAFLLGS